MWGPSGDAYFPKRAFSFIYLAKTEGLWSRKVKTLSGSKAPPFYWEIWAQKPFFRKKGFAICIGFQSFLLRGNGKSPRISSLFFIDFMSYGVRIEVELLLQNRHPLFLWSLIWTGWKSRFHRFFEDFKERKWRLIVVAVSTPPFFFFENCKKKTFNCCCSIDSPVFLRWKWLKTHIFGICCVFQSKKSESIFVCNIDSVIICCWKCLCIWI